MNTADQLIAGYTAYTSAEEFGAVSQGEAPATTPVLSFIGVSSGECGVAVSAISATTVHHGC